MLLAFLAKLQPIKRWKKIEMKKKKVERLNITKKFKAYLKIK